MVLVVITIAFVAFWALRGGFDDIPKAEAGTVVVTD
jgi:hypothetical protein